MALNYLWRAVLAFGYTTHKQVKNWIYSQDIQIMSTVWRLVPMETLSQVGVRTARSVYGTQTLAHIYELGRKRGV